MRWANLAIIAVGGVLVAGSIAFNCHDIDEMTELSLHNHMSLYGEGIYEYHALTGEWPSRIDDLARTSLPLKYPRWWVDQLNLEADAIVRPKNMKSDPKENGSLILAYHNKGLEAERGRIWVCWGDLRTGWITSDELQQNLERQKK